MRISRTSLSSPRPDHDGCGFVRARCPAEKASPADDEHERDATANNRAYLHIGALSLTAVFEACLAGVMGLAHWRWRCRGVGVEAAGSGRILLRE